MQKIKGNLYYYTDVYPVEVEIIIPNKIAIARQYESQVINYYGGDWEVKEELKPITISYWNKKTNEHVFAQEGTIEDVKELLKKSFIKIDATNSYGFHILKWNKHINNWSNSTNKYRKDRGFDFKEGTLKRYEDPSY